MTNLDTAKVAQPNPDMSKSAEITLALHKDIRAKWDKFSEIDVGALKSENDLVTQVVAKYSLDKTKALADVKSLVNAASSDRDLNATHCKQ